MLLIFALELKLFVLPNVKPVLEELAAEGELLDEEERKFVNKVRFVMSLPVTMSLLYMVAGEATALYAAGYEVSNRVTFALTAGALSWLAGMLVGQGLLGGPDRLWTSLDSERTW